MCSDPLLLEALYLHTNSFLRSHLPKKALSISQLEEGLKEEMGIRNEDHKGDPFPELLEIPCATWLYGTWPSQHELPTASIEKQNKQITEND